MFRASLPVTFLREKGQFVAYTPALDLSTSGDTLDEAHKRFAEAARIFLEECQAMGTLDEVRSALGGSPVVVATRAELAALN